MPDSQTPDYVTIGEIAAPHGVRGEIRVTMLSDFPDRFLRLNRVFLHPPIAIRDLGDSAAENRPRTEYKVMGARLLGGARTKRTFRMADPEDEQRAGPWAGQVNQVLLKLSGVNEPETAEGLRNYLLQLPAAEAWPLPEGQFYAYQIYNLPVISSSGVKLGIVDEIITTGGNDVYVVKTSKNKELLIPAIKDIVEEINPKEGFIRVRDPREWEDEGDEGDEE